MASSFMDKTGLTRLWNNIKDYIAKQSFYYNYNLTPKTTKINKVGDVVTSIVETSSELTATTTFSVIGSVKTITTNLIMNSGQWNYKKTVTITRTQTSVDIVESYSQFVR